jgi:hypothetical protein
MAPSHRFLKVARATATRDHRPRSAPGGTPSTTYPGGRLPDGTSMAGPRQAWSPSCASQRNADVQTIKSAPQHLLDLERRLTMTWPGSSTPGAVLDVGSRTLKP